MKPILVSLAVITFFSACNNHKTNLDANKELLMDTSSRYTSNMSTDTSSRVNFENSNRSMTVNYGTAHINNAVTSTTSSNKASAKNSAYATHSNSGRVVERKKGWSHSAKDAVIGGAGGAVTGAIISKHHGKGAIIGGLVGAGVGYVVGKDKDKKTGRK